jgi:hypothetical protein
VLDLNIQENNAKKKKLKELKYKHEKQTFKMHKFTNIYKTEKP